MRILSDASSTTRARNLKVDQCFVPVKEQTSILVPKTMIYNNNLQQKVSHRQHAPTHTTRQRFHAKAPPKVAATPSSGCDLPEKYLVACLPAQTNVFGIAGGTCDQQSHAVLLYVEAYVQLCLCSRPCETASKCSSRQCQFR